ncbi:MAG: lysostaphin resistance A-like protein [Acidimicrobiia bacterium]
MADSGKKSTESSSRQVAPSSRTNAPGGSSRTRKGRVPEAAPPPPRRGLSSGLTGGLLGGLFGGRSGGRRAASAAPASGDVDTDTAGDTGGSGSDTASNTASDTDGTDAASAPSRPAKKYPYGAGALLLVFLGAQVVASIAFVIAQSSTSYDFTVPAGVGAAVGQASSQYGQSLPLAIGVPPPMWLTALLQLPLWLALALGPVWFAVRKGRGVVADLGLRMRAIDVPVGLAIGVAAQLVLVPLVYLLLRPLLGVKDVSAAARELTDRATDPLSIVLVFLIVGLGAPVAEEIYFRGMAQRIFGRRLSPVWAIVAAAAFFAATHLQPLQFPALFLFGVILGVLAWRTGRLGPALWAHVGFNVIAAAGLLYGFGP